jgi:hypothetical protein
LFHHKKVFASEVYQEEDDEEDLALTVSLIPEILDQSNVLGD